MSDPISRKVEKAFDAYLTTFQTAGSAFQWTDPATATLAYIPVVQGRADDEKAMPVVVVAAQDEKERDDLPPGVMLHDVNMDVGILFQVDDGTVTVIDNLAQKILSELTNVASLQAALNKPSGTDSRTVTGFHLYDCYLLSDKSDQADRHWIHSLTFNVVCQGVDGP